MTLPGDPVDLAEQLARFSDLWSPRIVARLNEYKVQVVKVKGEFVWHTHEDTDEMFVVLKGSLTIRLRDRDVSLSAGQLYVVPRGIEHCPSTSEECHILLVEPAGTVNTGDRRDQTPAPEREV